MKGLVLTTTDGTPEFMVTPLSWGCNSDKKIYEDAKLEEEMRKQGALPARVKADKGFHGVEQPKNSLLTLEIPIKHKKRKGTPQGNEVVIEDSEEEEENDEDYETDDCESSDNSNYATSDDSDEEMTLNELEAERERDLEPQTTVKEEHTTVDYVHAPSYPPFHPVDVNGQFESEVVLKNWLIATSRVTIEQFFGRMKQWRLCGERVRNRTLHHFEDFLMCILIICKFVRKPLRK